MAVAATVAAGCGPRPVGVTPAGRFEPVAPAAFAEAARATVPAQRQVIRISWRSDDGHLQLSGSGAARIAPPDSLRADIAAALGLGRATVILTGDSAASQPPAVVDRVLPDRFALWAVLGVMRAPGDLASVQRLADGARTVWRVTDNGGRTTMFEVADGALVSVSRIEGDRTTSQLRLTRDDAGQVRRASLTDFGRNLRLEVEITGREPSGAFDPDIWQLRP